MGVHLPYHPGPGISGLMPGFVKMPVLVNPVTYVAPSSGVDGSGGTMAIDSAGNLTPTFGMGGVTSGLGAFMAARFPVPQNPVMDYLRGSGMGCACNGMGQVVGQVGQQIYPRCDKLRDFIASHPEVRACVNGGPPATGIGVPTGMGQLDFNISDIISGNSGMETYLAIGGGILALLWLTGGRKKYAQSRSARAGRKARVAGAQERYYEALAS